MRRSLCCVFTKLRMYSFVDLHAHMRTSIPPTAPFNICLLYINYSQLIACVREYVCVLSNSIVNVIFGGFCYLWTLCLVGFVILSIVTFMFGESKQSLHSFAMHFDFETLLNIPWSYEQTLPWSSCSWNSTWLDEWMRRYTRGVAVMIWQWERCNVELLWSQLPAMY